MNMPGAYRPGQSAPHGPYTYTLTLEDGAPLPNWLQFDPDTRRLHPRLRDGHPIKHEVTLKYTATELDSPDVSASQTFCLSESGCTTNGGLHGLPNPPNHVFNSSPAFIDGLEAQTATENEAFTYTLPEATDLEDDAISYAAALEDGSELPEWLSFAAGTRTFSGTPSADDAPATHKVAVAVTDDGRPGPLSSTWPFTLTVEEGDDATKQANTAPTFPTGAADQTATEGAAFSYAVPAATDPDDDGLTYKAALTGGDDLPGWLSFNTSTRRFLGAPGADDAPATLDITVTATDDGDPPLSGTTAFTLTVEEKTLPTADAGADVEGKRGEEGVVLDGSGMPHAKGSQSLTYQWSISGASHSELAGLSSSLGSADSATATFTVPRRRDMADRGALDDGNWIDFELTVTDGDDESASDTMRLTIRGTTWQEVFVSVADAEAEESSGSIDFTVTLDTAGRDPLSVDWATSDGTATTGDDFEAASGTLDFEAGETSRTVTIALLDDAIDEGTETFTLQLSNPQPPGTLTLDDGTATGTITNADPLQAAWLARFGRAVATEAVDALSDRIERRAQARAAGGAAGTDLSLLQSFFLSGASGYGGGGPVGYGAPATAHGSAFGGAAPRSPGGGAGSPTGMVGRQHAGLGGDADGRDTDGRDAHGTGRVGPGLPSASRLAVRARRRREPVDGLGAHLDGALLQRRRRAAAARADADGHLRG